MARTVTLTTLKNRCLQRADMVNTTFIDQTTELVDMINASVCELQDILIAAFGTDYYWSTYSITADGTNSRYSLNSDFYKLLGVDLIISTNDYITLKPYMFSERNRYKTSLARTVYDSTNIRYHIEANSINFIPTPAANQQFLLTYVPNAGTLSSGSDTVDGINGWEEYVVIDVAIKMRQKEETDTSDLERAKAMMLKRIQEMAEARDAGMAFRVTDVTSVEYDSARLFEGL